MFLEFDHPNRASSGRSEMYGGHISQSELMHSQDKYYRHCAPPARSCQAIDS